MVVIVNMVNKTLLRTLSHAVPLEGINWLFVWIAWTQKCVFCFLDHIMKQQENLGDLIAMTSLVILLKLGSNWFFSPCDHEIWWMTLKSNRAPLLYYVNLCASFQIHRWIQTGVTVRKLSIRVKIVIFFVPCDLEIWWMTLKNHRASFLYYVKLCASFHSHSKIEWIQR